MIHGKTSTQFLAVLAFALGLGNISYADDVTAFTRFKEGSSQGNSALQIAQASYRSAKSDVEIVLYGVVHIADSDYYTKVQKDLDSYDVVLWEGVKPSANQKPDTSMQSLGDMQKIMCDLLGLQFQKDGIDYQRDHFVHADMTFDQLKEAAGGDVSKALPGANMFDPEMMKNMAPVLKMGAKFAQFLFERNPAMRDNLKQTFGRQLGSAGSGNMPFSADMQRVLIVERNKVVMEKLAAQLQTRKKGSIAIFYGAAHMPDFHERLAKLGYNQVSKSWKSAWTMGEGVADDEVTPRTRSKPRPKARKTPAKRWF